MEIANPFEHFYPEELTPSEVHRLFVKEYTEHNYLTACKHTHVIGSRGSGKSMLFKFLEPACRAIEHGSWPKFLASARPFIAIYINCNTSDYRIKEFAELLEDPDVQPAFAQQLVVHEFLMRIVACTLRTITGQLREYFTEDISAFERIITALDSQGLYSDAVSFPRTLSGLGQIVEVERRRVRDAVGRYFQHKGFPDNHLQYDGNLVDPSLSEGTFLYVFLNEMREMAGAKTVPFFALFDEAGDLMLLPHQQKVINTLIAQRRQRLLCVKVSFRPQSYGTDTDLFGRKPQFVHDYDELDLGALYTNNTGAYYKRIEEIGNRRLQLAGFKVASIKQLLPERDYERELMAKVEAQTALEYDNLPQNKRTEEKQNYVLKYARARFFQDFPAKTQYWYTGFDNLVHYSSGVVRAFLDPCSDMVEALMQNNRELDMKSITEVPSSIQWDAIRSFSNHFVEKDLLEGIRSRDPSSDERKLLEHVFNLLESLGQAFKVRLMNRESRYPRIISFSVRETITHDRDLEAALKYALSECFLHKRWYRGKSGLEMLECYILNRRLCPRYSLDLSGFQGRIELTEDALVLAMKNTPEYVRKFKEKEKGAGADNTSQLEMFGY